MKKLAIVLALALAFSQSAWAAWGSNDNKQNCPQGQTWDSNTSQCSSSGSGSSGSM